MNVKTTLTLLDIGMKRCFIKFSFHFEGVLLVVRGGTFMFMGCSCDGVSCVFPFRSNSVLFLSGRSVTGEHIGLCITGRDSRFR